MFCDYEMSVVVGGVRVILSCFIFVRPYHKVFFTSSFHVFATLRCCYISFFEFLALVTRFGSI